MRRVLLITYDFPPSGGSGVQRPTKFAKFLPRFGWQPVVLTTRRGRLVAQDNSLLADVADAEVHRTPAPYPFRTVMRLRQMLGSSYRPEAEQVGGVVKRVGKWDPRTWIIPDAKVFWVPFGLMWAALMLNRHRCDLVLSSIPTPSAAILGWLIARMWRVPHIIDFRDPWAGGFLVPERFRLLERLELFLEQKILSQAAGVVLVREKDRAEIRDLIPGRDLPVEIITNGYDESDFVGVTPRRMDDGFTIAHVGVLYEGRDLEPLPRAFRLLVDLDPELGRQVHFVHVGPLDSFVKQQLEALQKVVRVSVVPAVLHREAIAYMLGADLLCLPTFDNAVPAKTFEYIRAGKPILGISDDASSLSEILNRLDRGAVFRTDDPAGIAHYVMRMIQNGSQDTARGLDRRAEFSREAGVMRLAGLLDRVAGKAAPVASIS